MTQHTTPAHHTIPHNAHIPTCGCSPCCTRSHLLIKLTAHTVLSPPRSPACGGISVGAVAVCCHGDPLLPFVAEPLLHITHRPYPYTHTAVTTTHGRLAVRTWTDHDQHPQCKPPHPCSVCVSIHAFVYNCVCGGAIAPVSWNASHTSSALATGYSATPSADLGGPLERFCGNVPLISTYHRHISIDRHTERPVSAMLECMSNSFSWTELCCLIASVHLLSIYLSVQNYYRLHPITPVRRRTLSPAAVNVTNRQWKRIPARPIIYTHHITRYVHTGAYTHPFHITCTHTKVSL